MKFITGLKILVPLLIIAVIVVFSVEDYRKQSEIKAIDDKIPVKVADEKFPSLDLPLEYFSEKDVRWGSVGNWEGEKGIKRYKKVALDNIAVYQSYPTLSTTIKNYSSEVRVLKTKTFAEIKKQFGSFEEDDEYGDRVWTQIVENYREFGILASNYLPEKGIVGIEKFDVDGDGASEVIVTTNYMGAADGGSSGADIIKNNKVVFSVDEDQSTIVPADTTDGFYVEWKNDNSSQCCPSGYMRTRFVKNNGEFLPVYEQGVGFVKIGIQ